MQDYWRRILVRHLDEQGDDLIVCENLAVSIRRFEDISGTTFDAGSVLRIRDRYLIAEGTHGAKLTSIKAPWSEIQSITLSYKCP
jgi:hypothetical protein